MVVDVTDKTYANGSGNMRDYGTTGDCYNTIWPDKGNPCGPKGTFRIDTNGTGLVFNSQAKWTLNGWRNYKQITWSDSGMVIDGLCGGYCGWCSPDRLRLESNPADIVPEDSAIHIRC